MDDLSKIKFPNADIEGHIKKLRSLRQSSDPSVLAAATARGKAVAPAYCNVAHAIADMIDVYRINGFSAGEAVQTIWEAFLEPVTDVPVLDTSDD